MAFVLVRIDDRLIHGQVTVAWGTWLKCDRIILVNDEVARTPWKRDLYADADSLGTVVSVLAVDDFLRGVEADAWAEERALVVVESPRDLAELLKGGLRIDEANIGGMHHAPGKRELLPYVYVDDDDDLGRPRVQMIERLEATCKIGIHLMDRYNHRDLWGIR